jgi:hypothetical protein
MFYRILIISVILLMFGGIVSAQEKAAVFEFEGIGVDQPTVKASSRIFANELNTTGKYTVLPQGDIETKLIERGITDFDCFQISCAASYGSIVGAQMSVIGSLTRLGARITVEARLIRVATKEVIFADHFAAGTIEDLDVALRKVARALATQTRIESEVTRYAITEEETREARRKKSYITSGASYGFGFPICDSYADVSRLKTMAWSTRYDAGKFVVDNTIGITWGGGGEKDFDDKDGNTIYLEDERSVAIIPWDIGIRYLFNYKSDISPFIGGGLGLHFVASKELSQTSASGDFEYVKSDAAMAIHLTAGLYAFQSYDFRLTFEGKYTYLMTDAFLDAGDSQQFGISISISRKFEKGEKRGCMGGGCIF